MRIVDLLQMWIEAERAAHNHNHVRHLSQALGEVCRLEALCDLSGIDHRLVEKDPHSKERSEREYQELQEEWVLTMMDPPTLSPKEPKA